MKSIAPHEPQEQVLSAADAFADAQNSEARWQAFEARHGIKRVFIELPEPTYNTLEQLAGQQQRSVSTLIERVIQDLVVTFAPMTG
ncbi:MAG: ribbon-helix-helix protein, CopG family [Thermoflexales bacterium]|nr:ribbon-helix-helix protein, CopG family [Thermoflexales bacterium]